MGDIQGISDSELEIMKVIWEKGGRILFSPLMLLLEKDGRTWKPNTVLTFLSRLAEKGLIGVEKQGRLNEYIALCTEEEYMEALTRSFLGKVYGGDAKGLVASLLKQDCLSKNDIDELTEFWNGGKDVK